MKHNIDFILILVSGMIIGSVVGTIVTASSFLTKIRKYEVLLDRIGEDNPGYFDNVLCETDEWCALY